ncbi:MAG: hypothetical protein K2H09_04000, partial [Treponemataceae bacterium]|nr:hypothetical protein [Treponemataceae bacterium]
MSTRKDIRRRRHTAAYSGTAVAERAQNGYTLAQEARILEDSEYTAELPGGGRRGGTDACAKAAVKSLPGAAFLAFPGMAGMLRAELAGRFGFQSAPAAEYGELLYFPDFPAPADGGADAGSKPSAGTPDALPYWAKSALLSPKEITFPSIGSGAAALRAIQRSWAPYSYQHFRRTALIQEKLPHVNMKARRFPVEIPTSPIGLYTLLGKTTMLASESTGRILPAGHIAFEEDHENPPSRAYLKLQEGLAMAAALDGAEIPHAGQRCFEAGAC